MKRLILIIMGVLLCTPLYSDMNTYVIGSGVEAGGATYIINQNFEGTGYDNDEVWVETNGASYIYEDYTTTVLKGSQSCALGNTEGLGSCILTSPTFTAQSEIWIHFLYQRSSANVGGVYFFDLNSSGGSAMLRLYQHVNGTFAMKLGSDFVSYTTETAAAGSTVHLWIHYKSGDGTAEGQLYVSTTGTRGTADLSKTDGTATDDVTDFEIYASSFEDGFFIIDQVVADDAEFTSID